MSNSDTPERTLGLVGATGVGVGAIIGGGILVLAGVTFSTTGPSAVLAFALNGLIAILTALSFAEMSTAFPVSGGAYVFAKKVLSVRAAFGVGWVLWFAYVLAGVLYALGFAAFGSIALAQLWVLATGTDPVWLASQQAVIALALLAVAGYAFALTRSTTGGGQWATWGKVLVFAVLIGTGAWVLASRPSGTVQAGLTPFFPEGIGGLLRAMGFTFIALQGFDLIAAIAGEVKDPGRVIPRAMLLSLGVALAIYLPLLFIVATVGAQPGETIMDISRNNPDNVMAVAVRNYLGAPGYWLVMIAAVLSTLSALQASLLAASRVAQSMAGDRLLPIAMSRLATRNNTPVMAVCVTASAIVITLLVIPDVASAGATASLIFLISFALAHLTSYLARKRRRGDATSFRAPFFPAVPLVGGVACTLMAVFQGIVVPAAGITAMVWLGLGLMLYLGLFAGPARAVDAFAEARDPDLVRLRGRSPLVLVPISSPRSAPALVSVAVALAPREVGRVLMLTVISPPSKGDDRQKQSEALDAAQRVLREAMTVSVETGHSPEALMTFSATPWTEIIRVAREHACEGLLLSRADLDLARGGQLENLMNRLDCDVTLLRAPDGWLLSDVSRILVLAEGRSHQAEIRARLIGSLCHRAPQEVTWLRVVPSAWSDAQVAKAVQGLWARAEDRTPGVPIIEVVRNDDVVSVVASRAVDTDLVILGLTRDSSGRRLFGNLAPQIAAATDRATIMISQGR